MVTETVQRVKIEIPKPHSQEQASYVRSVALRQMIRAGRRFGKTVIAIEEMVGVAIAKKDRRVAYFAPTRDDAREITWAMLTKKCENGELIQGWIIYEHPITGHHYVIAADVAEGLGQDSSAAVVIDFTARIPKIVATYTNNKIDPGIFAYELQWAGHFFKSAFIAVERNNHGHTTILRLRDIYSEDRIFQESTNKWGWHTNLVTKPKMMFDLAEAIQNELLDIPSRAILAEMQTYDKSELSAIRFNPEATKHWDLLMATAIGFQMRTELVPRMKRAVIVKPSISKKILAAKGFPRAVIHKMI